MQHTDQQAPNEQSDQQPSTMANAVSTIDAVAPTGWKMKLAKAAAQLIAGTEKGAVAYAQVRERIDTIEGRTIVSAALANAVAAQAVNDPELMERAKARFLGTALSQQENIEAVVIGANHYLPMLPAPSEAGLADTVPKPLDDEPAAKNDWSAEENPLNADWAATFSGVAENASTEELRDRLSRVLAGELASPGTYSRATVRAIAELERSDLEAVRSIAPYVLGKNLIRTASPDPIPSVDTLLPLSDAALITDANAMLSITSKPATVEAQPVFFGGAEWGLRVFLNVGQIVDIPVVPLTRTGVAVVDLLGRADERAILKRIAEEMSPTTYAKILLGRINGANSISAPIEQLFPKPIVSTISAWDGPSPFNSLSKRPDGG